jgi:hypothetical protein
MKNILKLLLKNIVKSYKTSLLGLLLIAGAIASIFYEKATWTEATGIILIGLGLLLSPDSIKNKINSSTNSEE